MKGKTRNLLLLFALAVCVLAAACVFVIRHKRYEAVYPINSLPRVGDRAAFTVRVLKPKLKSQADYIDRFERGRLKYASKGFVVKCIESHESKRTLAVYCLKKNRQPLLYYKVYLNYGAEALKQRSLVRDAQGKIVPPGRSVRGWPVPFHYWLAWSGMNVKDVYLQDEVLTATSKANTLWREQSVMLSITQQGEVIEQVTQFWRPGDWLWHDCDYWTLSHDDYEAKRVDDTD